LKTSQQGLELIKRFEGFSSKPYLDPVGIPTIGYGHTFGVTMDMRPISEERATEYLKEDVLHAELGVKELVRVPLTQNQFDALVSFTYNLGVGNFELSTLLRKLNSSRYDDVSAEFGKWIYAGGKRLRGLEERRRAEAELFMTEVTS